MGGEVIIISRDPDDTEPPVDPNAPFSLDEIQRREQRRAAQPKVQVTQLTLKTSDAATPDDIALAVGTVLRQAAALREL